MTLSTAEQAASAFYRAFERTDLAAMMSVWAEDEEIVCVHPGGERLVGFDAVRDSWRLLFSQGPRLRFQLLDLRVHTARPISVHHLYESITIAGAVGPAHLAIATNILPAHALGLAHAGPSRLSASPRHNRAGNARGNNPLTPKVDD
jgi:ketosteroid isomerase-like protein